MKSIKGSYGYFKQEKKKRLLLTLFLFAVPLLIFFTGLIYFGKRETLFTVIAIVGSLPACKSLVGLIMVCMQKSLPLTEYEQLLENSGDLTMIYELFITSNQKSGYIDAFAVCGNQVVGYTSSAKTDIDFMSDFIKRILHQNGYKVSVKILTEFHPYLERLHSLTKNREALEKDIDFTPDEKYPDLSREALIKHLLLAISL